MFIYNLSIKVDKAIAESWKQWVLEEHIPSVMKTNCFTEYQFAKLLEVDESEGLTFVVQYYAESKADYNRYMEIHAARLRKASIDKWNDQFLAFRTLMEVVQ